jgi:hypothetical protein
VMLTVNDELILYVRPTGGFNRSVVLQKGYNGLLVSQLLIHSVIAFLLKTISTPRLNSPSPTKT